MGLIPCWHRQLRTLLQSAPRPNSHTPLTAAPTIKMKSFAFEVLALVVVLAVNTHGQNMTSDAPSADPMTSDAPAVDTTVVVPVVTTDAVVDPVDNSNGTDAPVVVTDAPTTVVVTDAPTTEAVTVTDAPTTTTMAPVPCDNTNENYPIVKAFVNTQPFNDLSENEQIFIYEMLAASEGCNMIDFIKPTTAERIFRLLLDLPLRYVPTFVRFLSTALQMEGVVVPV